jgi:hypothetical protein
MEVEVVVVVLVTPFGCDGGNVAEDDDDDGGRVGCCEENVVASALLLDVVVVVPFMPTCCCSAAFTGAAVVAVVALLPVSTRRRFDSCSSSARFIVRLMSAEGKVQLPSGLNSTSSLLVLAKISCMYESNTKSLHHALRVLQTGQRQFGFRKLNSRNTRTSKHEI